MSRLPFALIALCIFFTSAPGLAQTSHWPIKPVKIIAAYPPSGTTDVAGRLLADQLTKSLGRQVVVENRAGAGGMIGALSVVRAEPDGYTLLLAASPEVSIAPVTVKAMQYDPLKDLQPIALVGQVPFVLVAHPGFPPNTLAELITYAKVNPDKLNYSSFGNNTSNYLFGELFKLTAGIKTTHVPYKGSGPSITDLMGGQIQYTFDTPSATLNQVHASRLKAIAVATPQRLPSAPAIPTMTDAGLPGFVGGTWFGPLAPAQTPKAVIDAINAATVAALKSPDLRKALDDRSIQPGGGTPEEFGRFIASEVAKWQKLALTLDIKPE